MKISSSLHSSKPITSQNTIETFGYFSGLNQPLLPAKASDSVVNLTKNQTSRINNSSPQQGAYGSEGSKGGQGNTSNNNTSNFIAITGGFKGDGSDVTNRVVGNSSTEKIYITTQQQAHNAGIKLNGLYIAPGDNCKTTVATVTLYQQDECGWLTCPQGEPHSAESPSSTLVVNHQTKADDVNDPMYKNKIHRYMEEINKESILSILDSALTITKKQ
ncbi:MAG: hypothetical protein R3E89_08015 [Thiolinea sp.]